MDKIPITVVILTLNDEPHLPELLDSIQPYVEDIFIVDSRSVDRTVDIALERGVKIVQRPFSKPSDQYAWAFKNLPIKTDWLFSLDQDERMSPELIDELHQLFTNGIPKDVDAYTIRWRLWFFGQKLHVITDSVRLLRVKNCHVTDVACDEHFYVDGKQLRLKGFVEHKDVLSLHEYIEKQNMWTTLSAIGRFTNNDEAENGRLFGTPLQRKMFIKWLIPKFPFLGDFMIWFRYYFLFGAWRDGYAGWLWARQRMWVHRTTLMKIKEYKRIGLPKVTPTARHGDFDSRVITSELQKKLLPETIKQVTKKQQ